MPCPLRYVALVYSLAIITMSMKASELTEVKTFTELFLDLISGRFLLNFFANKGRGDKKETFREPKALQTSKKRQRTDKNYERCVSISRKFLGLTAS